MLATVMNGSRQSWKESADGLTETVGAPSLREKRRVGRRWWTMRRSDGTRRRRPPRSVSPRAMGGVLRSTREEGARLRVPPRGRGAGDDQWCSPPSSCASSPPPLGESAVVGEVGLLVVIPPSPRFALPCLDAGVVGQSVTRLLPGSRCPAGTAPGPKRVGRPRSGPAAAPSPRSEPARTPRPGRESLRPPPLQSELQPLPGEPPSGSLTGTATTPGDAPRQTPPARTGPGLHNASPAQHDPPRLAPCEPGETESTRTRSASSHLAQCQPR